MAHDEPLLKSNYEKWGNVTCWFQTCLTLAFEIFGNPPENEAYVFVPNAKRRQIYFGIDTLLQHHLNKRGMVGGGGGQRSFRRSRERGFTPEAFDSCSAMGQILHWWGYIVGRSIWWLHYPSDQRDSTSDAFPGIQEPKLKFTPGLRRKTPPTGWTPRHGGEEVGARFWKIFASNGR